MGWTSMHRAAGISNAEFASAEILGEDHTILAHHTEKRGAFYAAVRTESTGDVWALVVLMQWAPGYCNFTYKAMDETVGPNSADAPAKVLDLLTPTTSEFANQWRARCRKRLAFRQGLVDRSTVRFARPLSFTDGSTRDTFTYRTGRRSGLYANGQRIQIPDWMNYDGLTVTPPAAG